MNKFIEIFLVLPLLEKVFVRSQNIQLYRSICEFLKNNIISQIMFAKNKSYTCVNFSKFCFTPVHFAKKYFTPAKIFQVQYYTCSFLQSATLRLLPCKLTLGVNIRLVNEAYIHT